MTHHPHLPVLCEELVELLDIQPNDCVLDCTIGFGGHAQAILEKLGPSGRYIGVDQDPQALSYCAQRFENDGRVSLIHSNAAAVSQSLSSIDNPPITKALMDLGVSSWQLDTPERGFSFMADGPLDMRMNPETTRRAADILNQYSQNELSDLFFQYAELKHNKNLCEAIVRYRRKNKIETTKTLVDIAATCYPFSNHRLKMKILSQIFQALRIETNQELDRLKEVLALLPSLIQPNGRVAMLTFHSLEDRIVKHAFQDRNGPYKAINKKVIQADWNQKKDNSRSRSAKLRIAEVKDAMD